MRVEGALCSHTEHLAQSLSTLSLWRYVSPQWPLFLGLPAEPLDPKRVKNLGQSSGLLCRR